MKLLETGRAAGCDWTANGRRSRENGRRGLRYGTLLHFAAQGLYHDRSKVQIRDSIFPGRPLVEEFKLSITQLLDDFSKGNVIWLAKC